jgi:hypothetical protein
MIISDEIPRVSWREKSQEKVQRQKNILSLSSLPGVVMSSAVDEGVERRG